VAFVAQRVFESPGAWIDLRVNDANGDIIRVEWAVLRGTAEITVQRTGEPDFTTQLVPGDDGQRGVPAGYTWITGDTKPTQVPGNTSLQAIWRP
jgi:hypothetical protein